MLSREERARIFLPFDALSGFREALREKEKEYIVKKDLSEEIKYDISNKLNMLDKEDNIVVRFYNEGEYKKIKGIVKGVSSVRKKIFLQDGISINFEDILELEKC